MYFSHRSGSIFSDLLLLFLGRGAGANAKVQGINTNQAPIILFHSICSDLIDVHEFIQVRIFFHRRLCEDKIGYIELKRLPASTV